MFSKTAVCALIFCSLNYGGQPDKVIVPVWSDPNVVKVTFIDKIILKDLKKYNRPVDAKRYGKYSALHKYGWGSTQFACLNSLWVKESNWSWWSKNKDSGAYGIPQAWPATKLATEGRYWRQSAKLQVDWGLKYVKRTYGTPCSAWSAFKIKGWY